MATSARHALYYIAEVTFGTTPASPAMSALRHTGTTLGTSKTDHISEELRSDRQIADYRNGQEDAAGDVAVELSHTSFDSLLEAVMAGTWAVKAAAYTALTISALASDNSINDSASGLPVLEAGDRVTISGFTGAGTTANQVGCVVVSSTASKMVLTSTVLFINDTAGESVTVTTLTMRLKAGTTRRSFSLLRYFSDIAGGSSPYHMFTGMEFNKFSLKVPTDGLITGEFGLMGKLQTPATAAPSGGTLGSPTTTQVMDSFTAVVKENGTAIAIATELDFTIENGMQSKHAVGSKLVAGQATIGRSNVSGTMTLFFEDSTMLAKYLNNTQSSLKITVQDDAGNAYRFTFPKIIYTGGQPDTNGQNGEITIALPFQAVYDATTATNLTVERIPIA